MADDYTVGFKRPPTASRFKKGQSGNPQGRPRGARNLKTEVDDEFAKQIEITEGGRRRKITKGRALAMAQFARGLKGDTRAADWIAKIHFRASDSANITGAVIEITPDDEEILEALVKRRYRAQEGSS